MRRDVWTRAVCSLEVSNATEAASLPELTPIPFISNGAILSRSSASRSLGCAGGAARDGEDADMSLEEGGGRRVSWKGEPEAPMAVAVSLRPLSGGLPLIMGCCWVRRPVSAMNKAAAGSSSFPPPPRAECCCLFVDIIGDPAPISTLVDACRAVSCDIT